MATTAPDVKHSNKHILRYVLVICLAPVIFGFDYGGTTGFLAMPSFVRDFGYHDPETKGYKISADNQILLTGTPLAFAALAAWISGYIGTIMGRRVGLMVAAVTSLIGPAVQAGAIHWAQVVVGRCISGAAIGFAYNFAVAYWSETTPARMRGSIVVLYQGITNVAQFVAQCTNEGTYRLNNRWSYRIPLLLELIAPAILFAALFWMPDTPRSYVSRGKHEKGLAALRRFRGPTYTEEEIQTEIQSISAFVEIEQSFERSSTYLDCFRGTDLRRTLITLGVTLSEAWSGIAFISSYGTYFFQISGIQNPFIISVVTGVCGIAGSAASLYLVRNVDRKTILLFGTFVCGTSMLVFAIVGVAAPGSKAAARCLAAFVSLYIFAYGASWGPVASCLVGEISSTKLRSKTIAIATAALWVSDVVIVCTIPYLIDVNHLNLGTKVGFIFGGLEVVILCWVFTYVPETKDRSLEEIDEMFLNKIPARDFKNYVATGRVQGVLVQEHSEKSPQVTHVDVRADV